MVDKLEKYGHKRIYYRLKAMAFVLLIVIALTAFMAIPVGISVRLAAEAQSSASSAVSPSSLLRLLLEAKTLL